MLGRWTGLIMTEWDSSNVAVSFKGEDLLATGMHGQR